MANNTMQSNNMMMLFNAIFTYEYLMFSILVNDRTPFLCGYKVLVTFYITGEYQVITAHHFGLNL